MPFPFIHRERQGVWRDSIVTRLGSLRPQASHPELSFSLLSLSFLSLCPSVLVAKEKKRRSSSIFSPPKAENNHCYHYCYFLSIFDLSKWKPIIDQPFKTFGIQSSCYLRSQATLYWLSERDEIGTSTSRRLTGLKDSERKCLLAATRAL